MKRLFYVLSATAALALVVPTLASAETTIIKRHDGWHHHHDHGWHRHEGWHHHHGDRTIIIKRHHHDY